MWVIKDFQQHSFITSNEHAGSVMSSQIMSLQKSKHYGPLLRPAKLGRGLGSEPGQTMSYCTWGFEAKDSVPKSSHLTHTHRSYQSSAITMIPAVTSV